MRRRKFLTLLGGAIGTWPLTAAGQQKPLGNRLPTVGFVGFASESVDARTLIPFREAMRALGYIEGQSIVIQARSSQGDVNRGHVLISELAALPVDVFLSPGPAASRPNGPRPSRRGNRSRMPRRRTERWWR